MSTQKHPLVAASCMKIGLQSEQHDRQFHELADYLKRVDVPDVTASSVYRAHQLVRDHLKAYDAGLKYDCSDNAPKQAIVNEEEEDIASAVTQYTSLLPRISGAMRPQPPYLIENR